MLGRTKRARQSPPMNTNVRAVNRWAESRHRPSPVATRAERLRKRLIALTTSGALLALGYPEDRCECGGLLNSRGTITRSRAGRRYLVDCGDCGRHYTLDRPARRAIVRIDEDRARAFLDLIAAGIPWTSARKRARLSYTSAAKIRAHFEDMLLAHLRLVPAFVDAETAPRHLRAPARKPKPPRTSGERLRAWRLAARLTLAQLAREFRVSGSLLSRWERGKVHPPAHRRAAILEHCGIAFKPRA